MAQSTSVRPTPRQLEFQDWEFGLFLHFGIRTFYEGHRDWDNKPMSPENFNPAQLDCNQWAQVARDAGAKYFVLTAKHHDGFALWPSKYTEFSVAQAPWKNGRGDVVREYVEACRTHDLAVGLYYSPADWSNPHYDDPQQYDDYFIAQVSELMSGYGPIDMLWFDGCGSEGHQYNWPRIIGEIRRQQPNILIFNMGDPDYRWIGNEAGIAPLPCWNVVESVPFSIQTDEQEQVAQPMWLPAECDCRIRDLNWFYADADADTVKSLDELLGLYYLSVGRGCNLLINISPDRRGLLPDLDSQQLRELGAEVQRRFAQPLATLAEFEADQSTLTWTWKVTDERSWTLLDHVMVQEDLTQGEQVRQWSLEVRPFPHGDWLTIYKGENIGHKAIVQFPTVRAKAVRLRVTQSEGEVLLRALNLFHVRTI
jgi:alpha-L-fucosidase